MRISIEEKKFIESLSNLSGVSRENIDKVFSAFILFVTMELYAKLEEYYADNHMIDEEIVIKIPYFLKELKISIKEKESKGGIGFDAFFQCEAHEYLLQNIHQLLKNETPDVKERLKLEIFEGLSKMANRE